MTPARTLLFAIAGRAAVGNLYWAQPLLEFIASDLHASTASAGWRGSTGSQGSVVENPAWGAPVSQGMGVRAPSRPRVSGQLAMASGSTRRSKGTSACGRPSSSPW